MAVYLQLHEERIGREDDSVDLRGGVSRRAYKCQRAPSDSRMRFQPD